MFMIFHPRTFSIEIIDSLPFASQISLKLFDLSGRRVITLFEGYKQPGIHTTILNATDLTTGLYFIRLEALGQQFSRKVMLIR